MVRSPSTLANEMCSYCSTLLHTVTIPHMRLECQLRRSMYCPVCVAYGHSPRHCPNKIAWAVRKGLPLVGVENAVFKVKDSDESIKAFLKQFGASSGIIDTSRLKRINGLTRLELRKLLNDFANSVEPPRMIVFVN